MALAKLQSYLLKHVNTKFIPFELQIKLEGIEVIVKNNTKNVDVKDDVL